MGSPAVSPSADSDNIRKRVCKACDRCRLKKSKCDGSSPCGRCKADNAICVFGERKKSHDKVYPKGYVEMLENQQAQLVTGLQELYRRLQAGESWDGPALKETTRGTPLTHEILEHLGALKSENGHGSVTFEENLEALQSRMLANGAGLQREDSFDSVSSASQSPMFESASMQKAPHFSNPWVMNHFPPTPPFNSPRPSLVKTSSPLKSHVYSSTPQYIDNSQLWVAEPTEMMDTMDYNMACDTQPDFDMQAMHAANQVFFDPTAMAINPCLTMKEGWSTQDEQMSRYFQNGGIFT